MASLFEPAAAPPTDDRGTPPMQPACARRLQIGQRCLFAGARADDLEAVSNALDDIVPLLSCQFRNDGLPCAHACCRDVEKVIVEYQVIVIRR